MKHNNINPIILSEFENIFLNNKYTKWYINIIDVALIRGIKKPLKNTKDYVYYESHHILPKSIAPAYKSFKEYPSNCVLLTIREHFLVHWLLTKAVIEKYKGKMIGAFRRCCNGNSSQNKKVPARIYTIARMKWREYYKGSNHPYYGEKFPEHLKKQWVWNDEKRRIHSVLMKEVMKDPIKRQKISDSKMGKTGKKISEDHKLRISIAQRNPTSETRKRKSESKRGAKNGMFGKTIYNNGIISKAFEENLVPDGWIRGRLRN